uniref:ShKT domain-containing protein n=1 Tax=Panagrolaimus davidi TaxID=227884 RepID=A0A914QPQ1_9BILA
MAPISYGFEISNNIRCQDDRGRLLPVATFCEDDRKDCKLIFKDFAHDYFRPYLCDKNMLKPTALQCAKTCGICCERFDFGYDE